VSSLYFRFKARGVGSADSPLLSRLLTRADKFSLTQDWRAEASGLDAASAPLALFAAKGVVSGAWACFATPVHYTAEMSSVRLGQGGILRLSEPEALALAADFNQVWHDAGVSMTVGRFADLFCRFDVPLQVITQDPDRVLGQPIEEFLPLGPDAARLRRLMSETEMWLFQRARPGLVNGLWLWGGGAVRSSPDLPNLKTAGEDVLFNYFQGDVSQGGIVSAPEPNSAAWPDAEVRWLEPAVAALKSGRIDQLMLSAADRRFRVTASRLRRFWRRDRAWHEHFQ
jgi:hypothetical protein